MVAAKRSHGASAVDVAVYIASVAIMLAMVYPLLHVISLSVSRPDAILKNIVTWFPRGFQLRGYQMIFQEPELLRSYLNTVEYAVVGTLINLLLTSLMAYPLSVRDFVLKRFLNVYVIITMFLQGGFITVFLVVKTLGLLNTFWAMVLPTALSGFNIVVYRTFFKQLPEELRESAYIDGANDYLILFRIILPLSKALLATFALFSLVIQWNSWFWANIFLQDDSKMPIQILLRRIVVDDDLNTSMGGSEVVDLINRMQMHPKNMQMAAVVVTMIPILCVYPFLQRYFTKGVTIGAIKG